MKNCEAIRFNKEGFNFPIYALFEISSLRVVVVVANDDEYARYLLCVQWMK